MREAVGRLEPQEEVAVPKCETEVYRPSNQETLREYEITIRFLNRGCVVRVGCKEIAFESIETAMKSINDYVANPYDEQQKWRKNLN